MRGYYINTWIVNIKMTSIYNKLWNKQDELFFLKSSHLQMGQGSWNEFKRRTNHFISWNHACIIITFESSILFCNVNNNLKSFY